MLTLGLTPCRLSGTDENRAADDYLPANFCPFARACLNEVLGVSGISLAGVVLTASCQGLLHLYNALGYFSRKREKRFFVHLLDLPRWGSVKRAAALQEFASSLRLFTEELRRYFGTEWSNALYLENLARLRQVRFLLRELYRFLREHPGRVRAAGVLELVRAAGRLPKEELIPLLLSAVRCLEGEIPVPSGSRVAGLLEKLRPRKPCAGPRLLLVGSPPPLSYVDLLEELGGAVVGDDFCQGYRYCLPEIEEGPDAFLSLARGYLERVPCPRMLAGQERFAYLSRLAKEWRVQGIIYHALKFCDSSLYEYVLLRDFFSREGIPVLYLETDYRSGGLEQARTRLQAFLEVTG